MLDRLQKLEPHCYALLRMASGFLFAFHGAQKVLGLYSDSPKAMWTQLWVGGVIELVAGTSIALGFQTRLAAFLASGTMAVAYAQFHWKLQWGAQFFPAINKGELAAIYSLLFLYFSTRGTGKWGLR